MIYGSKVKAWLNKPFLDVLVIMIWALVPMGQHELAPTNAPIGSFVHWLGRDFSLGTKCGLTTVYLFGVELFLGFFFGCFFPNFDLTYLTTIHLPFWPYLPTKNQVPLTHLLDSRSIHHPTRHPPLTCLCHSYYYLSTHLPPCLHKVDVDWWK
jgi:hypothetical protein